MKRNGAAPVHFALCHNGSYGAGYYRIQRLEAWKKREKLKADPVPHCRCPCGLFDVRIPRGIYLVAASGRKRIKLVTLAVIWASAALRLRLWLSSNADARDVEVLFQMNNLTTSYAQWTALAISDIH